MIGFRFSMPGIGLFFNCFRIFTNFIKPISCVPSAIHTRTPGGRTYGEPDIPAFHPKIFHHLDTRLTGSDNQTSAIRYIGGTFVRFRTDLYDVRIEVFGKIWFYLQIIWSRGQDHKIGKPSGFIGGDWNFAVRTTLNIGDSNPFLDWGFKWISKAFQVVDNVIFNHVASWIMPCVRPFG